MRNNSTDLILNHMFEPPAQRQKLAPNDIKLLERVEFCYCLKKSNLFAPDAKIINILMNQFGINRQTANNVVAYARPYLDNIEVVSKQFVKYKISTLLDKAITMALEGDTKTATCLIKAAEAYGRTFKTDLDEGEVLDAKKHLTVEKVEITTNPTVINVNMSEKEQQDTIDLMKKYKISFEADAIPEAEIVSDEPGLSS